MQVILPYFLATALVAGAACANDRPTAAQAEADRTYAAVAADTLPPAVDTLPLPDTLLLASDPAEAVPQGEAVIKDAKSIGVPGQPASGTPPGTQPLPKAQPNEEFVDVAALDATIRLDIRYATTDNFTKKQIYDCPRCLLRPVVARALVKAHRALQARGYGLKMYDCYRPRPYQQRLWNAVPDANYVTPPSKGSMHSRGAAVDLTVVDAQGKELDMGTAYDFFGREAHTDYVALPPKVLANRRLLRETMKAAGFDGIRTEWWHFSYRGAKFPLASYVWPCD
jgi:D-alanyl-D-alanine dipeptidase